MKIWCDSTFNIEKLVPSQFDMAAASFSNILFAYFWIREACGTFEIFQSHFPSIQNVDLPRRRALFRKTKGATTYTSDLVIPILSSIVPLCKLVANLINGNLANFGQHSFKTLSMIGGMTRAKLLGSSKCHCDGKNTPKPAGVESSRFHERE